MNCILLEMPRRLTLSVKPFAFHFRTALARVPGVTFQHRDLNVPFWRETFAQRKAESLFDAINESTSNSLGMESLRALAHLFPEYSDSAPNDDLPLSLTGLDLPPEIDESSTALTAWARSQAKCPKRQIWVRKVLALLPPIESGDLVCFGIDSNAGLAHAAWLAFALKRIQPRLRLCLARHAYESYSLLHNLDAIVTDGALFNAFDSIIIQEESAAHTVALLCREALGFSDVVLHNLIRQTPDGALQRIERIPSMRDDIGSTDAGADTQAYFDAIPAPAGSLLYLMELVRNRCYFAKCTFCTHINRHASAREFEPASEVNHALDIVEAMYRHHGVSHFSLLDEAVAPRDLRAFAEGLLQRRLPIHWTARLIADSRLDSTLLNLIAESGCREVLFGLETVNPATARAMRKISADASENDIHALIKRLDSAGIDVILNFIYRFPTESDAEFEVTRRFITRLQHEFSHLIFILNGFELYAGSQMFSRPNSFNIQRVETRPPERDLKWKFNYIDGFGRVALQNPHVGRYFLLALGLTPADLRRLSTLGRQPLLRPLFELAYGSYGFIYRQRWNRKPLRETSQQLLHQADPSDA